MITSRTFQIGDRFAMRSRPSAPRPAHASSMPPSSRARCLRPPFEAIPESRREASMNASPMYRELLPVLIAAKPMTMVKMTNVVPTVVRRTTPSNSNAGRVSGMVVI